MCYKLFYIVRLVKKTLFIEGFFYATILIKLFSIEKNIYI